MINVRISASTLCDLLAPRFTYEACEKICEYLEDCGVEQPLLLGDIVISFSEVPADYIDDYEEENIIATLRNGNILVSE